MKVATWIKTSSIADIDSWNINFDKIDIVQEHYNGRETTFSSFSAAEGLVKLKEKTLVFQHPYFFKIFFFRFSGMVGVWIMISMWVHSVVSTGNVEEEMETQTGIVSCMVITFWQVDILHLGLFSIFVILPSEKSRFDLFSILLCWKFVFLWGQTKLVYDCLQDKKGKSGVEGQSTKT